MPNQPNMPYQPLPDYGSPTAPAWGKPRNFPDNYYGDSPFPVNPPTPPSGKLNYNDWYAQIGKNMAYPTSIGGPSTSYLDYIGYNPTSPTGTPTAPTGQPQPPGATAQPPGISPPVAPNAPNKANPITAPAIPFSPIGQYGPQTNDLAFLMDYGDPASGTGSMAPYAPSFSGSGTQQSNRPWWMSQT